MGESRIFRDPSNLEFASSSLGLGWEEKGVAGALLVPKSQRLEEQEYLATSPAKLLGLGLTTCFEKGTVLLFFNSFSHVKHGDRQSGGSVRS